MSPEIDLTDVGNAYEVMKLVPQAIGGDPRAAAALWRELAADCSSSNFSDIQRWLQHVAQRLVAEVIDGDAPANRKAEAARRAVGLSGQIGDAELHLYVAEQDSMAKEFGMIDMEGNWAPLPERVLGWSDHVQMARQLIEMGMVEQATRGEEKSHLAIIAKRIARIRQTLA